jgi:hypothetical protein
MKAAKKKGGKKVDIENIENTARDIIDEVDILSTEDIDVPDNLQERIQTAGIGELDQLEKEYGLDNGNTSYQQMDDRENISSNDAVVDDEPLTGDRFPYEDEKTVEKLHDADGSFKLTLAEDNMSVTIDLYPSKGNGDPLTFEAVNKKLESMKIVFGLNYDLLKKLIQKVEESGSEKTGIIIARGKSPTDGKDGRIEFKFAENDNIFQDDIGQ